MPPRRKRPPRAPRIASIAIALAAAALASEARAEEEIVHRAQRGDTLIGIGRQLLATPRDWREVARLNRLPDPDRIQPDQPIRIPVQLLRGTPAPGRVLQSVGDARLIAPGGAPRPAQPGDAVDEGATVVTGDGGYVTIALADGSTLRVQAATRAELSTARALGQTAGHRSALRLLLGRIETLVEQIVGGAPRFEVRTPQAAIAVRGTDFRVAVDGAKAQTRSEVLSGTVELSAAAQRPLALAAGFAAAVDATRAIGAPVALLAAPDVAALPAVQERLLVRFAVPVVTGAAGYRAQVARDRAFQRVAGELTSATPELRFAGLEDAEYFLRVRAIDAAGFEGHDAVHAFRLKARPEPPTPSVPAPRARLPAEAVEFSWAANPAATRYRMQVARDAEFAAPLRSDDAVAATSATVSGLPPGTYYWRLASVRADGDRGPWGDAQPFELRALPPPPAPPAIGDASIRLAWGGAAGQTFEFQLARDAAFGDLVLTRTLVEPTIEFERPGPGRYYLRYRARDADGYLGPFTSPQTLDLPNCVRTGSGGCAGAGSSVLRAQ